MDRTAYLELQRYCYLLKQRLATAEAFISASGLHDDYMNTLVKRGSEPHP